MVANTSSLSSILPLHEYRIWPELWPAEFPLRLAVGIMPCPSPFSLPLPSASLASHAGLERMHTLRTYVRTCVLRATNLQTAYYFVVVRICPTYLPAAWSGPEPESCVTCEDVYQ